MYLYIIVSAAWVVVTVVSWIQGNRRIPIVIASVGLLAQIGIWVLGLGFLGVATLAILTVICMLSVPEIFLSGKT